MNSKLRIVPAIDLINGGIVRLSEGNFEAVTSYDTSPLDQARAFYKQGFRRLHVVDLDGAKNGVPTLQHQKVVKEIFEETDLVIDFSGGISSAAYLSETLAHGASMAIVGSIAVKNAKVFHSIMSSHDVSKIILAADCRDGWVYIDGWKTKTDIRLFDHIQSFIDQKGSSVMITDIARDGLLKGANVELYRQLRDAFPDLFIIASGGVASNEDLYALSECGINEVIVGKALYAGRLDLAYAQEFIW